MTTPDEVKRLEREQDAKVAEAATASARWVHGAYNNTPTPECEIARAIRAQGEQ